MGWDVVTIQSMVREENQQYRTYQFLNGYTYSDSYEVATTPTDIIMKYARLHFTRTYSFY